MALSVRRAGLNWLIMANRAPVLSCGVAGCLLLMALAWQGGVHPTVTVGRATLIGGVAAESAWEVGLVDHHVVFRIWRREGGIVPAADGMLVRWSGRGRSVGPDAFLEANETGVPGLRFGWYRTQLAGTRGGSSTTVREFRVLALVVLLFAATGCRVGWQLRRRQRNGRPGFVISG